MSVRAREPEEGDPEQRWLRAVDKYQREQLKHLLRRRELQDFVRFMEPPPAPPLIVDFKTAMWWAKLQPPPLDGLDVFNPVSLELKGEPADDEPRKVRRHRQAPRRPDRSRHVENH